MEEQAAIFCDADDFCNDYEKYCIHSLLMDIKDAVPKTKMALSEIMTILIMYHLSGYRTFKLIVTEYIIIVFSANMRKQIKVLWDGSMVSDCIWLSTTKVRFCLSALLQAMRMTEMNLLRSHWLKKYSESCLLTEAIFLRNCLKNFRRAI